MPILTTSDKTFCKHAMRSDAVAKAELRAALLAKVQWVAALQALDDRWETNRAGTKAAMEAAAGVTLSNSLAKKLAKAWMDLKYRSE